MHAIPHKGCDHVRLGMDRAAVRELLGEPDLVEELDVPPESGASTTWSYQHLALELSFDEDVQFKLARITIFDPGAEVLGFRPIGLSKSQLRRMYPGVELVYSFEDMKEFIDEALDVSFWMENGRVVNFTLSPKYVVDDTIPCWP
ncbi:MAG TPA: hypothetical protein VJA21_03535 [Verrucomicrobiae bacterium]